MVQKCCSLLALLDAGIYSIYDVHIPLPSKGVQMIWPRNVGGEVMNCTGTQVLSCSLLVQKCSSLLALLDDLATQRRRRIESRVKRRIESEALRIEIESEALPVQAFTHLNSALTAPSFEH